MPRKKEEKLSEDINNDRQARLLAERNQTVAAR